MKLGLVIGNVVSTRKEGNVKGLKILVVSYLDEQMNDTKKTAACIDTVSAGEGDIVLLCSSSSARLTALTKNVATDNTIVAIVDSVSSEGKYIFKKNNR
jgi:ethanolamine utilization protein EutN